MHMYSSMNEIREDHGNSLSKMVEDVDLPPSYLLSEKDILLHLILIRIVVYLFKFKILLF